MKKRTRQLDDAREIIIGRTLDGEPVHTTAGELRLDEGEREQLQDNVNAQARVGSAEQAARLHMNRVAAFYLKALADLAPRNVVNDYVRQQTGKGNGRVFAAWFTASGLHFGMDGLTAWIKRNGRVLGTLEANGIPKAWRAEVLRQFRGLVAGGEA